MFIPHNCMFITYKRSAKLNTLSLILSSKVRAEIFRIFFNINDEEIHLREIERKTGFAIGTVRQETTKLVKIGLLNKRKDGNRTYYIANRAHPLFQEIHNIVIKTVGLVDIFRIALENQGVQYSFIFGSIAKGIEKPDSDIDLFVIGNIGLRKISKLLKNCSEKLGREINIVSMNKEEFVKRETNKEHFVSNVMESPKIMIIGNEDGLTRLGK